MLTKEQKVGLDIQMAIISFLAYAIENDEPFNVSLQIVEDILRSMQADGTVPELALGDDGNGRMKVGVILVKEPEEEK